MTVRIRPRAPTSAARAVRRSRVREPVRTGLGDGWRIVYSEMVSREFPDTHWSQLAELGGHADDRRRELLDRLVRIYWRPAYHYVRSLRRLSHNDAEDLTQQFFTTLLGRGDFDRLSPSRGSFRGFLKTSLHHFVISADRKTAGRPPTLSFDEVEREWTEYAALSDDEVFERAWVAAVLREGVDRLEAELRAKGKTAQFEMFRAYCLDDEEVSYQGLASRFRVNVDAVTNRLRETRARLRQILHGLVREYVGPDADVERELASMLGSAQS